MSFYITVFFKQLIFLIYEIILTYKTIAVYKFARCSFLFKRIWYINALLIVHDFAWYGLGIYRSLYREFVSDVPQPTYLWVARFIMFLWPLVSFFQVYINECLLYAQWKPQKRHYVFGAATLGVLAYFGYCLFIQEASDTWLVLDPFGNSLARSLIMIMKSVVVCIAIKRLLVDETIPLITKKQTKLVCTMFVPGVLIQPLWMAQTYGLTPQNSVTFEIITFIISFVVISYSYQGAFALMRLRMFNAYEHVQELFPRNLSSYLVQAGQDINDATKLEELGKITQAYFETVYGFHHKDVMLYIRATHHERNTQAAQAVRTLDAVEAVFATDMCAELREKIKHKRCVIRSAVEYDERLQLDAQAPELRSFMEKISAEVFIPIYRKTTLVGYIVVERTKHTDKVASAHELENMLVYAQHLSYAIADLQKGDIALVEKECFAHQQQVLKCQEDLKNCYESIRELLKAQTSEVVSMIFYKQRGLRVASTDGAKLLGLPEGTSIVKGDYEQPILQMMHEFKKYKKERSIILKDAQRNPLRLSVVQDSKKEDAVVLVSRPAISDLIALPSFVDLAHGTDWVSLIFLRLTTTGKALEKCIPATQGPLFDFKIKFLEALTSRRPILLLGEQDDVQRLAALAHHSASRTVFHEFSLKQSEQDREFAIQLFGTPGFGSEPVEGVLSTVHASGTILIEHVERLSLETQALLADFFTTGLYASFFSKQRMSSNATVICSSQVDLKQLVEQEKFSAALFEELSHTVVEVPCLATLPKEQLEELIHNLSQQMLGESPDGVTQTLSEESVEQLLAQLPKSICALRQQVQALVEAQFPQQLPLVETGLDDVDALVSQARLQGRALLKNKKLFSALVAALKSYVRVAEILDVDRTTVYRTCKKYGIHDAQSATS